MGSDFRTTDGVLIRSWSPRLARTNVRPVSMITTLESRNAVMSRNCQVRVRVTVIDGIGRIILFLAPMYSSVDVPVSGEVPFTDYSRWRLLVNDGGRHTWHYMHTDEECRAWPQNLVDKFWLGLPMV